MKEKKNEKSLKKQELRKAIVKDYKAGVSVEKLMEKYDKSKKQVVGILVYEGIYKKENSERDKIIKELKFDKEKVKRIPLAFLQYLYENFTITSKKQ